MHFVINGHQQKSASIEWISAQLTSLRDFPTVEVWLQHEGPSLGLFKSSDRAFLIFLRADGDPGLTSRASDVMGDQLLEFTLSNGQVDVYPATWTVPFDEAQQAMESFFFTKKPAPFITWVDDAAS